MHPARDHVRRYDEFLVRGGREDRGIVAEVEGALPGQRPEIAIDDGKLVGKHEPSQPAAAFVVSSGRVSRATRSRTPFTSPGSSAEKNALAMSTYSLMATRAGTSRRERSSKTPLRRIARRVRSMRVRGHVGGSAASMIGSIRRCPSTTPE